MFTPSQLEKLTLEKARFGGYDTDSVDNVLAPLIEDYTFIYNENAQLKFKIKGLIKKFEQHYATNDTEETARTCEAMLLNAQNQAAALLERAKADAAYIKAVAEADAARIKNAAKSTPEFTEAVNKAAAAMISDIQAQMSACVDTLEQLKADARSVGNMPAASLPKPILTGKPSIDKPWLKFYPPGIDQMLQIPPLSLNEFMRMACANPDLPVIHYYGNEITWKQFFAMVDNTARALRAIGLGEGSQIPVFLRATPEFLVLLLAAERIGASLLCRDQSIAENAEAIAKSGAQIIFAHDFITREEVNAYTAAGAKKIILINPWNLANKKEMPQHIVNCLERNYTEPKIVRSDVCDWDDFQAAGRIYIGKVDAAEDLKRPVYRCYSSDSSGAPRQIIHSAQTMLGVICQMTGYGNSDDFRPNWLVTLLSPALVGVTVSMMLVPMASNRLLILDPFVDVYDIDLELMRYKPNVWPLIPMFMEILMKSKRIPEDYDMSHLLACGVGSEAINNGQIRRAQKFLGDHNCHVTFSISYSQSEACSNITFPAPGYAFGNGNIGIPMPLVTMTICRGTEELSYGKLGEICILSPGNMLGYDNMEDTEQVLIRHEDGNLWLHTGDTGYMNEDGVVFALSRNLTCRYHEDPAKRIYLADIMLENLVCDAPIPGLLDCFFVIRPDKKHKGFYVPYMYAVLKEGYSAGDIAPYVNTALDERQRPVEIIQIPERPFQRFKTDRLHMEALYYRT